MMKKSILVFMIALLLGTLTGCGGTHEAQEGGARNNGRFVVVGVDHSKDQRFETIVDAETGVTYLFAYQPGYHYGGLTVVVDGDGNPVIWNGGVSK